MQILNAVPEDDSTQVVEAHSLLPDAYVDLFELALPAVEENFKIFISPIKTVQWAGREWEALACNLTEVGNNASAELVRPKFQIVNPGSIFSLYIAQGKLDNASLRRYRVLTRHLNSNENISLQYAWKVGKILNLTRQSVTMELRAFFDGQKFQLPIRKYFPPDFTHVSLG